jgi:hypothetical protein
MFMQVIQGKVKDEAGLQAAMDRWERDLMPGAIGYLGTTAGTCDDGTFIAIARFESADAARQNSDRPEQGAWWAETAGCFDGDVAFMDCDNVHKWMAGGSDDAGFVQVMEGHSPDVKRMHSIMEDNAKRLHQVRPEIIGGVMAEARDGDYVDVVYFTSEDEARKAEKMDVPDDVRPLLEEEMRLMGEVRYFDLHHPRLVSAQR